MSGRGRRTGAVLLHDLGAVAARVPTVARYALAVVAAAIGTACALLLSEIEAPAVFAPSLVLTVLTITALGLGPSVLLVALLAAAAPLALDPQGSFDIHHGGDVVGWLLFIVTATLIVLVGEALRRSRARLEAVGRRTAFLAEASLALESPASVEERLQELTRLAVPGLGDWCAIDLLDDAGGVRLAAVAHVDPERVRWAWELRERFPPDPDGPTGVPAVVRTGRSEFYPVIPEELIEAAARSPEELEVIRQVGFTGAIVAPLTARGRTMGALTLVTAESGRPLTEDDLLLTEELARRAALALDLATMYEQEVAASERLRRLQRVTAALAEAVTHREVAQAVIDEGTTALGADAGAVSIRRGDRLEAVATAGYPDEVVARFEGVTVDADMPGPLAVRTGEIVALAADELFARYPGLGTQGAGHRSLLAAPLVIDGETVGFLGFSFRRERAFPDADVAFARTLAQVAAAALARAGAYETEHAIAQTLQRSLLPSVLPEVAGLALAVRYRPLGAGTDVGGDFYDAFEVGGGLAVVIGDVCGKGVEAAALTALARHSLRVLVEPGRPPSDVLAGLNRAIIGQRGRQSLFLTAALALLTPEGDGWRLRMSCAGHPLPVILGAEGTVRVVGRPGPLLGPFADVAPHDSDDHLAPGEALLLYTDGVTEARRERRMFGDERLAALLAAHAGADAENLAAAVEDAVIAYQDGPLADDLALVVVRAAPAAAPVAVPSPALRGRA